MKLHLGGTEVKDGWILVNAQPLPGVDIVSDIRNLTGFEDESCEVVYGAHVLEHVPQKAVVTVLNDIYRILKPGGHFLCSVPDLETLSQLMVREDLTPKDKFHVMRMLYGGQTDEYDYHYVGFTFEFLIEYMKSTKFSVLHRVEKFGIFNDTSDYCPWGVSVSLNVIFKK